MHSAVFSRFFLAAPDNAGGGGIGGSGAPLGAGVPPPDPPEPPDAPNAGTAIAATPTARMAAAMGRPFPRTFLITISFRWLTEPTPAAKAECSLAATWEFG
jgi:hypothetical protein